MFCSACGGPVPQGSAFCPSCGAALLQPAKKGGSVHPALVALSLILLPPLGIVLMWAGTDWSRNVKWAVTGIFFPPAWLAFLWKVPWLPYAVGGLLAALTIRGALFEDLSSAGAIVILLVIAVTLLVTFNVQHAPPKPVQSDDSELRDTIEEKLDLCHQLIAEIESDFSLDLLPAGSPVKARYRRALEMRSQAQDLFHRAATRAELFEADTQVYQTLRELRSVRRELPEDSEHSSSIAGSDDHTL